ncbi:MAG: mechanosensitive ion channel family protein [Methanobacteriota archaeon]
MNKNLARLAMLLLASIVVGACAVPGTVNAAPADVVVLRFDNYSEEVEMGATAHYHLSFYNNGTTSVFVHATVQNGEAHWEVNATPEFVTVYSGGYLDVAVEITAPMTRDYPTETATLTVNFTDLETGEEWSATQSMTTELRGGGIIPERKILGIFENPFHSSWMNGHWGVFVLNVISTAIIALFLVLIFPPIARKLTAKTETKLDDMLIEIVRGPTTLIFILLMCVESMRSLPITYKTLHSIEVGFDIIFVFAGAWMIYKIFKDVVIYYAKKMSQETETELDDVLIPIAEKLGAILIAVGATAFIMRDFGIDITVLVAGMGVLGVVIGFAMQESLGNFIGGIFLLTDRPFKTGDDIQLPDGTYCKVIHVGMRTTKLYRSVSKDIIILPNSDIANKPIINLTQPDRLIGANVKVGVAYDSDMEKVKKIMFEIVNAHPDISHAEEFAPLFRLSEFADSSVNVTMFFSVKDLSNMWRVQSEVREEIFKRFAAEGVEIPFPQRVVHLKKDA